MVTIDAQRLAEIESIRRLIEYKYFNSTFTFTDQGNNIVRIVGKDWDVAEIAGYLLGTNMITHYFRIAI